MLEGPGRPPSAGADVALRFESLFGGDRPLAQTRADGEGRFCLRGLGPARYRLIGQNDGRYGEANLAVGIADCRAELQLVLASVASVRGRVVIGTGDVPCPGATAELEPVPEGAGGISPRARLWARADDRGQLWWKAVLPGRYRVSVLCEGHTYDGRDDRLTVADVSLSGRSWRVRPSHALAGRIEYTDGAPAVGIADWRLARG